MYIEIDVDKAEIIYLRISKYPYYQQRFCWKPDDYPNAMRIGRQTVSLPLSAKLTDEDVEDVIMGVESRGNKFPICEY